MIRLQTCKCFTSMQNTEIYGFSLLLFTSVFLIFWIKFTKTFLFIYTNALNVSSQFSCKIQGATTGRTARSGPLWLHCPPPLLPLPPSWDILLLRSAPLWASSAATAPRLSQSTTATTALQGCSKSTEGRFTQTWKVQKKKIHGRFRFQLFLKSSRVTFHRRPMN